MTVALPFAFADRPLHPALAFAACARAQHKALAARYGCTVLTTPPPSRAFRHGDWLCVPALAYLAASPLIPSPLIPLIGPSCPASACAAHNFGRNHACIACGCPRPAPDMHDTSHPAVPRVPRDTDFPPLQKPHPAQPAAHPLLTPSGRALAHGGALLDLSTDPTVPCVLWWPDNEPRPHPGQVRPPFAAPAAKSTMAALPPIMNTGNRGPIEHQPGDWVCEKCSYLNWRRRKVCQTCYPYAEGNGDSISAGVQAERIALLRSFLAPNDAAAPRPDPYAPLDIGAAFGALALADRPLPPVRSPFAQDVRSPFAQDLDARETLYTSQDPAPAPHDSAHPLYTSTPHDPRYTSKEPRVPSKEFLFKPQDAFYTSQDAFYTSQDAVYTAQDSLYTSQEPLHTPKDTRYTHAPQDTLYTARPYGRRSQDALGQRAAQDALSHRALLRRGSQDALLRRGEQDPLFARGAQDGPVHRGSQDGLVHPSQDGLAHRGSQDSLSRYSPASGTLAPVPALSLFPSRSPSLSRRSPYSASPVSPFSPLTPHMPANAWAWTAKDTSAGAEDAPIYETGAPAHLPAFLRDLVQSRPASPAAIYETGGIWAELELRV
ncbi:hypothetical protein BV25DRAFT_1915213 [Artomyces pyxidatus]|uniref:Uncharacterized protein n=1 Tax=Artomyces pyxidatus TaxID=48021 RepID=A0ACB8T441_9AGAM|nr:hypothetical protein BV25DRAFT_1915213 [Artomyces pyxidatus]